MLQKFCDDHGLSTAKAITAAIHLLHNIAHKEQNDAREYAEWANATFALYRSAQAAGESARKARAATEPLDSLTTPPKEAYKYERRRQVSPS